MSKICHFVFASKQHLLGKILSKIFVFYTILLEFSSFLAILKVCLNDVEIWFFFFNGHFLIIMGFKICFRCFQNSITLDKK